MKLCKVVGKCWATVKDENLTGLKLLLARELKTNGTLEENLIVTVDELGAGEGDIVIIAEGEIVSRSLPGNKPIDALIVAIVESYHMNE